MKSIQIATTCQMMGMTMNDSPQKVLVDLVDLADVGTAISAARRVAEHAGFSETDQYLIATAVSELATNMVRYAGGGEVALRVIESVTGLGVEVVAQDSGPGIEDIEAAMQDNYSSGGSLGLGLPGIQRIMDEFSIESTPGEGTRCVARKWREVNGQH